LAVAWAYKHDAALRLPYQDNLAPLIHEPSFKLAAGGAAHELMSQSEIARLSARTPNSL
jgi:hypothetical protein